MRDALTRVQAERKLALALATAFVILAAAVYWIGGFVQATPAAPAPIVETVE